MLSPLDQALQIIAWLLALLEVSASLYILVLNAHHKANLHVSGLLLLYAVNCFAIGQLIGVTDAEAARAPTLHLAAFAPAIAPSLLMTALILVKPSWLEGRYRWLRWTFYTVIALPAILVVLDLSLGTKLLYSGVDPVSYEGGFLPIAEYLNGWLGLPVRVVYFSGMHLLSPLLLSYVACFDQGISPKRKRLAWFLLGMHVVIDVAMFVWSMRGSPMVVGLLFNQAVTAIVYTYAGFKQMISERWVHRGHLQNRLIALLLVVTVPIIAGIVVFIMGEIDSLVERIVLHSNVNREVLTLTLQRFKRTIWLVSGGALALVLTLVWLAVRQTLRPIRSLTETARAIAAGDLERLAPVESKDEVGTLARAFNVMTKRLRALINELEDRVVERTQALEMALTETRALYRVSDALTASSDLETILKTVVDTVAETLPASTVLLITLDKEAEEIVDFVSNEDKGVAVVPTPYADLMEGLTGWVLRTGQPALSPKGIPDPRESTPVAERRRDYQAGAIIVVPLGYQDETLGTLTAINRMDEPNFTEHDVDLMIALAGQAAAVVQNARLMRQTQVSLKETKVLYRLSRSLIEPQREEDLMQRVVDLVVEGLPADRVGIVKMDFEQKRILSKTHSGPGVNKIETEVTFDEMLEGLSGWAIQKRRPAISPKGQPDARESHQVQKRRAETDCGSILVVPLYYQDNVLGTMTAIRRPDQPNFTQHDAELAMTMANQAATAIQNVSLFQQTQQTLAETHALYNISRRLITSDNLEVLLQAVVDGVLEMLTANRAALITVDHEEKRILNFVGRGQGAEYIERVAYDELMEGLSGWVMRENRPALSPQGAPDPRESPRVQRRRAETACGGILVVPLHYQGKMLGTITAINGPDGSNFTQHDADLIMTLAGQASAAIENANLFHQTQAALDRTEMLYKVARSLIAYENLHDLLKTVSDAIAEILVAPWVKAITFDVDEREVLEIVSVGPDAQSTSPLSYDELDEGLTGWVIRQQGPALSSGWEPDPRESDVVRQRRVGLGIGAIIVTPLKQQDKVLGTITAMRRQGDPDFTERDVNLMMAMTHQAAAAVQNARLFEQTELALKETQALYRASQPFFVYEDLPKLLQSVVDGIAEALPASRVMLLSLDVEAKRVVDQVVGGARDEEIPITFDELSDGLTGWVLRNKQPAFSAKGKPDPRECEYIQEGRERYGFGSIIVVPLRYRDKIFGTITALNMADEPDFTQRDMDLMTAMASQAAAAIENARLFEQTRRALQETQGVSQVSRVLLQTRHPRTALKQAAEAVAAVLEADRAYVLTLDMERRRILYQTKGGPEQREFYPLTFDEAMEGLIGWVVRRGEPTLSPKEGLDPRESPTIWQHRRKLEVGSVMVAPLQYGQQLLGTISVINRPDQRNFTAHDLKRLSLMASQIAAAVDNARLFAQTQQALAKTEALNQIARSVNTLDRLPDKLQIVADQVAVALPADRVLLITLDLEQRQVLHHVTGGRSANIPRVSFAQLMDGLTGWVIRERQPACSPKSHSDPRESAAVRKTRLATGAGGILVVPLIYQEEVLGTLTAINRLDQPDFTDEDATLMMAMANQAAVAIQNARLVEALEAEVVAQTAEIRAQQEKTEAILQSVGDAIAMSDSALRIQYVNQAFTDLTGYRPEEILGRWAPLLLQDGRQELRRLWPSIRHELMLGGIWHGESVICRKDGKNYDAALTIAAMRDVTGRAMGYVTSHRNITQRKQLDRVRRDFLVNVSHQLRTPMATIRLYLQLMQESEDQEKHRQYLRNAEQETKDLIHLIEDMLTVAELDSGEAVTSWEEVLLEDLVREVITRYRPKAQARNLQLALEPPEEDIPVVQGDSMQLHKAVAELVENAVTFTPSGGHVLLTLETATRDGQRWVELRVQDDGLGLTSVERKHLFERFYRGRLAESGHIPGSGLGLVIAKALIEAHGGSLSVTSVEGKGCTFLIRLLVEEGSMPSSSS